VVWDLDENGGLIRVLPEIAAKQVTSCIQELSNHDFQAAHELISSAQEAFNSVPRRDRDACANVYDAMESVGRTRFGGATFGNVLDNIRGAGVINEFTLRTLWALEVVRHNYFGHGAEVRFNLSSAEVDYVYLTCIAGILLLLRLPQ
jgi:hypothetical protein